MSDQIHMCGHRLCQIRAHAHPCVRPGQASWPSCQIRLAAAAHPAARPGWGWPPHTHAPPPPPPPTRVHNGAQPQLGMRPGGGAQWVLGARAPAWPGHGGLAKPAPTWPQPKLPRASGFGGCPNWAPDLGGLVHFGGCWPGAPTQLHLEPWLYSLYSNCIPPDAHYCIAGYTGYSLAIHAVYIQKKRACIAI